MCGQVIFGKHNGRRNPTHKRILAQKFGTTKLYDETRCAFVRWAPERFVGMVPGGLNVLSTEKLYGVSLMGSAESRALYSVWRRRHPPLAPVARGLPQAISPPDGSAVALSGNLQTTDRRHLRQALRPQQLPASLPHSGAAAERSALTPTSFLSRRAGTPLPLPASRRCWRAGRDPDALVFLRRQITPSVTTPPSPRA